MSYFQYIQLAILLILIDICIVVIPLLSFSLWKQLKLKIAFTTLFTMAVAAYFGFAFGQPWEIWDESIGYNGILMYGLIYGIMFIPASFWKDRFHGPIGTGSALMLLLALALTFVEDYVGEQVLRQGFTGEYIVPAALFAVFCVGVAGAHYRNDTKEFSTESKTEPDTASGGLNPDNSEGEITSGLGPTKENSVQGAKQSSQTPMTVSLEELSYDWRYSQTTFVDIGGYYEVKEALNQRVLKPLRTTLEGDDRYERFGIQPSRGIMFYGPPGTGKTMFARALAGELGIPFVELSPGDVTSRWVNASTEQIQVLFQEAQALGPCVIFIDEAEHLFGARTLGDGTIHAEDRKVTSEFLVQLTKENREAIVVSATNRPADIDSAILRPGRLSAHFEVGLPDEEARHAILNVHLAAVPSELSGEDLAELASHTAGLTGAELKDIVEDARRKAAERDAECVEREDFPPNEELEELSDMRNHDIEELPRVDGNDPIGTSTPDTTDIDAEDFEDSGQGTRGYY
ncbi:ATP-binding protein [Haloarcula onubensis]|uniref:ATP-binding protein n=1 Tax=Haloarcula onubensis TaxID=2950539 RepID=A0ABU2FUD0_9EURY|nr:ATP-binding protein [Halomicroarcula sp. S3CR25-11]MDS0283907.1 ATP-binding protein [Halomicroarcula sp. S3CR25-11]